MEGIKGPKSRAIKFEKRTAVNYQVKFFLISNEDRLVTSFNSKLFKKKLRLSSNFFL